MFKTTILASILTLTSFAALANYDVDAQLQKAEAGYQEYEAYISIIDDETEAGLVLVDEMAARVARKVTENKIVNELIQKCAAEIPTGRQATVFKEWRVDVKGDDSKSAESYSNKFSHATRVRNAIAEVRVLVDSYKELAVISKSTPDHFDGLKDLQKKIDSRVDSLNADADIFTKASDLEGTLDGKNYCDFNALFEYHDSGRFNKMRKKVRHPTLGVDAKLSITDLLSGDFDSVLVKVAQQRKPLPVVREVLSKGEPKSSGSDDGVYLCIIYDFKGKDSENSPNHKMLSWAMMNPIKILKRDLPEAL